MHKRRLISILTSLAMMSGLLVALAAPASAQEPEDVEFFQPDGDYDSGAKSVLADQDDGTGETAHLTAIGTDDTDFFVFFDCGDSFDEPGPGNDFENFDADCDEVGRDEDPEAPEVEEGAGHAVAGEAEWDVDEDDSDQTFVVLACEGDDGDLEDIQEDDEEDNFGLPENCTGDREDGIVTDDADGGADEDYSTGEITGVCPSDEANDCDQPTEFDENGHGSVLPDPVDGFTVEFFTSDDVDDDAAFACLELMDLVESDIVTEPVECDVRADAVLDEDESDDNDGDPDRWTATFNEADLDDFEEGDDVDLSIGCDTDEGDCEIGDEVDENELIFDEHYKVFGEETPSGVEGEGVVLSFEEEEPDTTGGQGCEDDEDVEQEEFNEMDDDDDLIDDVDLEGCVFDEDGNLIEGEEVTAEIDSDFGEIEECEAGTTQHDHDGDGLDEHCHWDPADDDDGLYEFTVSNRDPDQEENGTSGTQGISLCLDDEATGTSAGTESNPAEDHGCDDEPAERVDSVVKHYGGEAEEIILVYADADPTFADCATGVKTKDNVVGDTDTLLVCTTDEDGTPASTLDDDEGRIRVTSSDSNIVQITSSPTETGTEGTATASIRANNPGTATLTAELVCDPEDEDCPETDVRDEDTVTKNVAPRAGEQPQCRDGVDNDGDGRIDLADPDCSNPDDNSEFSDTVRVSTNLTIRYDRANRPRKNAFKGSVGANRRRCQVARRIVLKKKRPGRDRTVGRDLSNRRGNWKVVKRRARGRFYAIARRKTFVNRRGQTVICGRDTSVTIRIRRRR